MEKKLQETQLLQICLKSVARISQRRPLIPGIGTALVKSKPNENSTEIHLNQLKLMPMNVTIFLINFKNIKRRI